MTVPAEKRTRRSRLPWSVRVRIFGLLSEGTEPDEIAADPEIGALASGGVTAADVARLARSAEYRRFAEKVTLDAEARTAERIAAGVLEYTKAFGTAADIARYELARLIRELIAEAARTESGLEERIRSVRDLSRSLTSLSAPAFERKLAVQSAGLAKLKTLLALRESEIARLKEQAGCGSGERIVEALNEKVGLGDEHEIPAVSETLDP